MGLQEDFEEYAEKAKTLPESTSNEDKLILYGLYKQATVGDADAFAGARDDTSAPTSAEWDEEAEKAEKPPRSHAASAGNRRGAALPPRPVQPLQRSERER
uniref:ACB domain-containing protein n=1 Tax=Oryza barthii TaxID=65489 RepID=A0A0D3FKN2_9ORYZ